MNGYTQTTDLKQRISNLIEQIPADIRNRAVAECVEDNPHDFERALTSYVISRSWLAEVPQSEHDQQQAEAVKVLDWLEMAEAEHDEWLDNQRTMEEARY